MRVPGRIYASDRLMASIRGEESLQQVVNVAHLPGILGYSLAMPDIHWGYGFPIGGVAAVDPEEGVISPGGVGYDINCGVRLAKTGLMFKEVQNEIEKLAEALFAAIPCGVGAEGAIPKLSLADEKRLLEKGVVWAVERGYGTSSDLDHTEEGGRLSSADPDLVSEVALERGRKQVGTLGSGNHFLEVDRVEEIYLPEIASKLGVFKDQIVVQIHSGSRGLGYQVCEDYLKVMNRAMAQYAISLPDRQLACAPIQSKEGKDYLAAMASAANYAWVNRQVIMNLAEEAVMRCLGIGASQLGMRLLYDVCHNIAKFEEHSVPPEKMKKRRVCVHRKGATRAFPPHHPQVPSAYQETGQPVLVPGDMGRCSFLLVGTDAAMEQTFGSTCHGAGRVMSRAQSSKLSRGKDLTREMFERGVVVRSRGKRTLAEEMPHAYKDVSEVVEVMEQVGISRKVAKLRPIAVIKG
jgi:tRNA-splicing ligase RtcB